jgi:membrane dipeptidase
VNEAWEINRRILVLDSHVDIPPDYATEVLDPGTRHDRLQADLVKMKEGGVDCLFLIAHTSQGPLTAGGYDLARSHARQKIEAIHRLCEKMHPDRIDLALRPVDVELSAKAGKLSAVIGLENGYPIGQDLSMIKTYHELGVRYITLCHNGHNQLCDSSNPPPKKTSPGQVKLDGAGHLLFKILQQPIALSSDSLQPKHRGLSEFGRQVVAEMNNLGIIVDVSHLSPESFRQVLETTKAPVIASHSSCHALCNRTRNLDDQQLLALKRNGGCVQITPVWGFLNLHDEQLEAVYLLLDELQVRETGPEAFIDLFSRNNSVYRELIREFQAGWKKILERFPQPNIADFVNHIDHAVKLIGIEHVGIGSDFGGGGGVRGFNNSAQAVNVTTELMRRGYTEEDIAAIWGGNLLRVWREVELVARNLRTGAPA